MDSQIKKRIAETKTRYKISTRLATALLTRYGANSTAEDWIGELRRHWRNVETGIACIPGIGLGTQQEAIELFVREGLYKRDTTGDDLKAVLGARIAGALLQENIKTLGDLKRVINFHPGRLNSIPGLGKKSIKHIRDQLGWRSKGKPTRSELIAMIETLSSALHKYALHLGDCKANLGRYRCTCGLDDIDAKDLLDRAKEGSDARAATDDKENNDNV